MATEREPGYHPDYPVVEGFFQMNREWHLVLPGKFNQRFEVGKLVFWGPDITIWASLGEDDHREPLGLRLDRFFEQIPLQASEKKIVTNEASLAKYSYQIAEQPELRQLQSELHCYALGKASHIHMNIRYQQPEQLPLAQAICQSLTNSKNP